MTLLIRQIQTCFFTAVVLMLSSALADDAPRGPIVDSPVLTLELIPRTPEQMMAFYEARGFPLFAIKRIAKTCYFTAVITNKSNDILWLEPNNWRFRDDKGKQLMRLDQVYWQKEWERLNLPMANRATFRWTLLPDVRDLQPGERAGGNVVIEPTDVTLTLEARFFTGPKKGRGGEVSARFEGLRCASK
ncbi:MAG: hypothetical protein OEY67_10270 [Gammaproteobacteria bacterium]|nr:hypothetical protein [Gammaproteobacteria bacterium]